MFFQNFQTVKSNDQTNTVIFACDPVYWYQWGRFTAMSCDTVGHNIHVHLIGNDAKCQKDILSLANRFKVNLSLTTEPTPTDIHPYAKLSYYYCARFYAARYLFETTDLQEAYITDCDIIFDRAISFPKDKTIGIDHRPHQDNIWRKVNCNLVMVERSKKDFISTIINRYESTYNKTNFSEIDAEVNQSTVGSKLEGSKLAKHQRGVRGMRVGLDQVSIAQEIEHILNDPGFFNLREKQYRLVDKTPGRPIWTLTGKGKRIVPNIQQHLTNRFKIYAQ